MLKQFAPLLKQLFRTAPFYYKIVFLNVAIYLVLSVLGFLSWLLRVYGPSTSFGDLVDYLFALPPSVSAFLTKPWTILSYAFFHDGFFHIAFNMVLLAFFGGLYRQKHSEKQFIRLYFGGLLAGALLLLAVLPLIPDAYYTKGADAAIMALMAAVCLHHPNYTVRLFMFGEVKIKYLFWVILGIDLLALTTAPDVTVVSLGGALFGYLNAILVRPNNFSRTQQTHGIGAWQHIFNQMKNNATRGFGNKYTSQQTTQGRSHYETPHNHAQTKSTASRSEELNRLRAKVSQHGYQVLTPEEKATFFKHK